MTKTYSQLLREVRANIREVSEIPVGFVMLSRSEA